jgi:tetratricopeptide (TPR) repeat protein
VDWSLCHCLDASLAGTFDGQFHHHAESIMMRWRLSVWIGVGVSALASAAWAQTPSAQAPAADTLVATASALMQSKSYASAAQVFSLLTQRHPEVAGYWVRLGVAHQLAGDADAALIAYRKGIDLGAGAVAQYNLGTIFTQRSMPDSAFGWLNASVGGGFSNVQALESDSDLVRLHADPRWTQLVEAVKHAAAPCMYRPESRAFDFWLGDWDVTNSAGQAAGKSSVQLLLNGCALYENWNANGNGEGKSLNSYNPDLKIWQQFWTDQTGHVTEYRSSAWVNGGLQYTARVLVPQPHLLHMTFTPVNKDLVRQFGEVSTDDGKTWTPQFDFYYHRRP